MALWYLPMIANAMGKTNQNGGNSSAGAVITALSNLKKQAKQEEETNA